MKKTEYGKITAASAAFFIAAILCIMLVILAVLPAEKAFGAQAEAERDITRMQPSGVKAASYNYSKIRISWDVMDDTDGYIVYRASSENGTYKKVYTTDNVKKTWYINTNRKIGQTWWYKVRGYQTGDDESDLFSQGTAMIT